jgi:lysophospholipase L1-like esterase
MGLIQAALGKANEVNSGLTGITNQLGYEHYFDLESFMLYGNQITGTINSNQNLYLVRNSPSYTHTPIFFQNAKDEIVFKYIVNDPWIVFGGTDYTSFSALNIHTSARPNVIRFGDLGTTVVTSDISCNVSVLSIGDYLKLRFIENTLAIYISKDNKYTWNLLISVNLLTQVSTINRWVEKKNFGMATAGGGNIGSEFQIYGSINTSYKSYMNSLAISSLKKWSNKTWNVVGDSITQQGKYIQPVVDMIGAIASNKGVASSTLAVNNAYLTGQSVLERVEGYSDANLWSIFAGVNDWYYLTPLGSMADSKTVRTSFYGATKAVCENILTRPNNPTLVFFTPLQSNRNGANSNGVTMNQYRQAIIDVCNYYSVPVIDLYGIGGFNPINLNIYTSDGVHPNDTGNAVYAPRIGNELNNLK